MTPREPLGLSLVRRMLARLSLAARVQELEAELAKVRAQRDDAINEVNAVRLCDSKVAADLHAARNEAQTAELQRARAAHRAEQMEREAVALRTRMEQAERDTEDLRRLEEQVQERAKQAEGERDEAQRLLEAARAELRARGAADHEPPRGASPLDAVARVPNLKRHRWPHTRSEEVRCDDCRGMLRDVGRQPCPGPKGGDGGR